MLHSSSDSREQCLQAILHAYLQARDRGEQPDRQAILDAHPDVRSELAAYFADTSKLAQMARSLQTATLGEPDGVSPRNSPGANATGLAAKIRYYPKNPIRWNGTLKALFVRFSE